jgi:omega-6 fatty acid desaturase / acyl-lipid omega-6 desaturase (Delta-12 desaturase)
MFAPHQFGQIIISDVGILLWLGTLAAWIYQSGFSQVLRLYLVPYLW